jgi:hypothetical protein
MVRWSDGQMGLDGNKTESREEALSTIITILDFFPLFQYPNFTAMLK